MTPVRYSVTDKSGKEVRRGDTVTDFRGRVATFNYVSRAPIPGKSAKVIVTEAYQGPTGAVQHYGSQREYYAGVFDLSVTVLDD